MSLRNQAPKQQRRAITRSHPREMSHLAARRSSVSRNAWQGDYSRAEACGSPRPRREGAHGSHASSAGPQGTEACPLARCQGCRFQSSLSPESRTTASLFPASCIAPLVCVPSWRSACLFCFRQACGESAASPLAWRTQHKPKPLPSGTMNRPHHRACHSSRLCVCARCSANQTPPERAEKYPPPYRERM